VGNNENFVVGDRFACMYNGGWQSHCEVLEIHPGYMVASTPEGRHTLSLYRIYEVEMIHRADTSEKFSDFCENTLSDMSNRFGV